MSETIAKCPSCGTYENHIVESGILEHHFRCMNPRCSAKGMIFGAETGLKGILKGLVVLLAVGGGIISARERDRIQ